MTPEAMQELSEKWITVEGRDVLFGKFFIGDDYRAELDALMAAEMFQQILISAIAEAAAITRKETLDECAKVAKDCYTGEQSVAAIRALEVTK